MVEQSIEAALVVSSSLILGIKDNRCAGIGRQVPFRPEWFHNCTSSSLVICNFRAKAHLSHRPSWARPEGRRGGGGFINIL